MKKALLLFLAPFIIHSCNNMIERNLPGSDEIVLEWEFSENNFSSWYYRSIFTLENNSAQTLGESGWALYYSQMGSSAAPVCEMGNVKVEHINGDLLRILPDKDFKLKSGETVKIILRKNGQLIKEVEAPLGPYFVYSDSIGNELATVAVANYNIKPFPPLDKVYPTESSIPLPSAEWVFEQNRHQQILDLETTGTILPSPAVLDFSAGKVTLGDGLMIHFEEGLGQEAEYLAKMLEQVMGITPAVMSSKKGGPNIVQLSFEQIAGTPSHEAYQLTATAEEGIHIKGASATGVFYGIQSMLALLPVTTWGNPHENIEINAVTITDSPAFEYRGMHLDIARNFIEPADIRKLISAMAFYKLNKLHLHLTDDEAWRLEIPSLPELTEVGGYRGHTIDNKDHLNPAYGSGPVPDPKIGVGSGYLTRDEFMDLLRFADEHHVEVIPEINFPGHSRAAIYAMEARYDRLMKEGQPEEALKYRLIDPDDRSIYSSAQNYHDNVVCVCKEAPIQFYETVVDEIISMYEEAGLTLKILHAGGDEVPRASWKDSPVCQAFLEEHPEIGEAVNLQAYLEGRLFEILKEKNLVMAGWEEIAMKKDDNGRWIPNPEFAGQEMLPYVWNSKDDYLDLGNRMANAGYPVILCNVTNFYFDLAYNHHPSEPGHYWGGFVNTRKAFEFAPYNVFHSTITNEYGIPYDPEADFAGMERLKPEFHKNIVGLQGELWSETIKGGRMLEYCYFPKMIALSERAWAGQDQWASIEDLQKRIEAIDIAWNDFANVVGQREMPRLDHLFGGFAYRLPSPGALIRDGKLHANTDFPGLTIRFTTDGSEPDENSQLYSGPVNVSGKVMLRSFDTRGRGSRTSEVE